MRHDPRLLCGGLLLVACGGEPAHEEPVYDPPAATSGGQTDATAPEGQERTLEDKIRTAELSATYEGPGDAPSPYEQQNQLATGSEAYATAKQALDVLLNGKPLGEPDFKELEVHLGARPFSGHYWYDARSGLWGIEGHGTGGVTKAGLRASELPRDISKGTTGVVVNGRVVTATELKVMLDLLGWDASKPGAYNGSYTLDADGKLHKVGGRYLGNLSNRAKRARASGKYGNPSVDCAIVLLGSEPGVLGRGVTINCD